MRLDPTIACEACRLAEARLTVAETATLLLLTPERIRQLVRDGVIPQDSDGIQMGEAIAGYRDFLLRRS